MGVVSGIVMSYQFGTNWSVFSDRAGPIVGPLMAYEVLTAFFLEAGFLGVMLFGMEKVGKGLHFTATCMVALGTAISAFWILAANSWMQTPAGWAINAQGQFVPAGSWLADHLQPELPLSLRPHRDRRLSDDRARGRRRRRLAFAARPGHGRGPHHVLDGDVDGGFGGAGADLRRRPACAQHATRISRPRSWRLRAISRPIPTARRCILFGLPDDHAELCATQCRCRTWDRSSIHDMHAPMPGLDSFPQADRPPRAILFWSFRIMVGLGFLMALLGLWSLVARLRGKLHDWRWLHRCLGHGPVGLRRGDLRLGDDRGRPPALAGLRPASDARRRLADRDARRDRVADRLRASSISPSSPPARSISSS